MSPSGLALKPYNSKTSWKKLVEFFPHFGDYLFPNLTWTDISSLMARVVYVAKIQNLKTAQISIALSDPQKLIIFKKIHTLYFVGIETFLCSGDKVLKN